MPVTDSIGDYLTRIRNAGAANLKTVEIPGSNTKKEITKILKDQGYISDFEFNDEGYQGTIKITLKYYKSEPTIKDIKRVSTPGRRVYAPAKRLPRVNNGLGIAIISTSHGVMSDKEARSKNIGGEVLCTVW